MEEVIGVPSTTSGNYGPNSSPNSIQVGVQLDGSSLPSSSHPDSDPFPTAGVHAWHDVPLGIQSPDVYFLPGYGRAASVVDGGEWVLLEAFDGAIDHLSCFRTRTHALTSSLVPIHSPASRRGTKQRRRQRTITWVSERCSHCNLRQVAGQGRVRGRHGVRRLDAAGATHAR